LNESKNIKIHFKPQENVLGSEVALLETVLAELILAMIQAEEPDDERREPHKPDSA
jgi:hypothetical protein